MAGDMPGRVRRRFNVTLHGASFVRDAPSGSFTLESRRPEYEEGADRDDGGDRGRRHGSQEVANPPDEPGAFDQGPEHDRAAGRGRIRPEGVRRLIGPALRTPPP